MRHPSQHIFHHTPDTLRDWCESHGAEPYRARQVFEWVYRKGVVDPGAMSNLPARLRDALAAEMTFLSGDTLADSLADDGTHKLLVQWRDFSNPLPALPAVQSTPPLPPGADAPIPPADRMTTPTPNGSRSLPVLSLSGGDALTSDPSRQTECVMIPSLAPADSPDSSRRTACISSQVGCPVGCRFCASGLGGLDANLSAGRIVEQAWRLQALPRVNRLTNIVFMGMGEPLSNFNNVIHAVRTLAAPWGMGISPRKITISTVGLPKAIERLAEELELPVTLALSLHAPTDELRRSLIPWAEYSTIKQLLAACHRWFQKTGREITLEYTLLREVNDQPAHAKALAKLAKSLRANINLIRYNEVVGMPFSRPNSNDVHNFQRILRHAGVNAHIRASRGRDIAAACGQLRHEHTDNASAGARPHA